MVNLCAFLQSDKRSQEEWQKWQTTGRNMAETLQSIMHVLKEGHDFKLDIVKEYEQVMMAISY